MKRIQDKRYIVLGCNPWNREVFESTIKHSPGQWYYIDSPNEFEQTNLETIKPELLFFLHWSWKVPDAIVEQYKCICFHPTDLPFGRGGTPIQNLILRGFKITKLSAFRMSKEMDAGPVYLKETLSLEGSAEEIYMRMNTIASRMIQKIIAEKPISKEQTGEIVTFRRRKPNESEIPSLASSKELYDFIRMLDAPGYPKAYFNYGGFRYEVSDAKLAEDTITATVTLQILKP